MTEAAESTPTATRRRRLLWSSSWIVATALLVALVSRVDRRLILDYIDRASWSWLAVAVVAYLAILPIGALQWWMLLPGGASISRLRMLRLFSITSVANNTTPSIVGHAAGGLMIAAEPGVGASAALSVITLDQVCVGVAKVAVLSLAAMTAPMPPWMRTGLGGVAGGVAILTLVLFALARMGDRLTASISATPSASVSRLVRWLAQWAQDLEVLRQPARLAMAIGYALLVKAAEGAGIAAVQMAFGLDVSIGSVALVLAASSLSGLVPIAPGNLGTYEAAAFGAYRALGLGAEASLGIALVQHATLLVAAILPGYLAMLRFAPGRATRL